ncbi:DsbC family protein [Paraglaciecola sp.]|uniref:DsbC family protein n=1 Tax=Paraglaciecola sp. TaxID=1920173 RepID=UPI003EF15426
MSQPGIAQEVSVETKNSIINGLKNGPAGLTVTNIEHTPISGIYQVSVQGNKVFYSSEDGQYIFTGQMFKVAGGKVTDVVQLKQSQKNIQKIKQVPKKNTIVYPATGVKKHQLNVFTDVDCPYCAKLHQEIPKLNAMGVEVVYLAFPRAGIHSPSFSKIASVWCSETPKQSINKMYQNQTMDLLECDDTAIIAQHQLALDLSLKGTPAIFFEDGKIMYGFHKAESLLDMLEK